MVPGATVGRKKKQEAKPSGPRTIGVRSSADWADWLDRLARHCRTDVAKVIDAALARHARAEGFDEPPPERVP